MNALKGILLLILSASTALAADTITGAIHNQTSGRPAAGDEVVLLRLGEGMQEEARTKTDAQGSFTLNVAYPNDQHIVRVLHQGVNYDQTVTSSAPLEMIVYDAVTRIPGLGGKLGIAQMESDGKILKVTEMYMITNSSNPPVTQSRPDNFEITVPDKAAFDSIEVKSGRGIWVKVPPVPLRGQKGKYAINFPMRPGDTLFKYAYHFPYQAPTTLHLRLPYPITNFGVMHPPSIAFKALRPDAFKSAGVAEGLQVEQSLITPLVGDVPAFQVSGLGSMPQHGTQPGAAPPAPPTVSAPSGNPHPAQTNPPPVADQSRKELWLMIAGIFVILALGVFAIWRMKSRPAVAIGGASPDLQKPLLEALKEELFQLESDRLHGVISDEEYSTTKQALNQSIQRAMARK